MTSSIASSATWRTPTTRRWRNSRQRRESAPRGSLTFANRDLERAIDEAGYYGRDRDAQRERLMPRGLQENIDLGAILLGGPGHGRASRSSAFIANSARASSTSPSHTISAKKPCTRSNCIGSKVLPRIRNF